MDDVDREQGDHYCHENDDTQSRLNNHPVGSVKGYRFIDHRAVFGQGRQRDSKTAHHLVVEHELRIAL